MTNTDKVKGKISNIINNKTYIGSYVAIVNNYKKSEVKVYTNKNGKGFYFVLSIFGDNYEQGVFKSQYYLNELASSLGFDSLENQEAFNKFLTEKKSIKIDNVLSVGF